MYNCQVTVQEIENMTVTYDLSDERTWARLRLSCRGVSSSRHTGIRDSPGRMVRPDGEFTTKYRDAAAYVPLISFAPSA